MSLTVASVATATIVVPQGPVAADQVSDLKAQATQITQDLVLEQLQISTYQQQYAVDVAKVDRDKAEIGSTENQIQADISRVGRDRSRLQSEAVSAYVNSGSEVDGTPAPFEVNQTKAIATAEYESVVSGDITTTIDTLHTDENGLRAERATLVQQQARDQATTNQEAGLTNSAHQTEVELASKQSEITGQLVVAVAQQQAAQARAAAAAVQAAQAAQAAASRSTTSTTHTTQPAPSSATPTVVLGGTSSAPTGDPSLPPFLQCVLQAESGGNYGAVSPGGQYMGGFQFSQSTWNEAANLGGMPQLVNVPPNQATPAEQDDLAIALYNADGQQPWNDRCHS